MAAVPTTTASVAMRPATTRCTSCCGLHTEGDHMSSIDRSTVRLAALMAATGTLVFVMGAPPLGAQELSVTPQSAENTAIGICGTCHGTDGNSTNPMFPRLAGQHAGYIVRQLKFFKDESRADPYAIAYMWGMASGLSDDTVDALAQYYARQKTGPGKSHDPAIITRGRDIFEHGIPAQGVP